MRKILLFFLPLLCLTACEPQVIDDPAFLNGTWEGPDICYCEEKWRITFQDNKLITNHWLRTRHIDNMTSLMCSKRDGSLFFWNYELDESKTYRWNFRRVDINVDGLAYLDTVQSTPFDPIKNRDDYGTYVFKRRGNILHYINESGARMKFHKLKN